MSAVAVAGPAAAPAPAAAADAAAAAGEAVKVFVRVRCLISRELHAGDRRVVFVEGGHTVHVDSTPPGEAAPGALGHTPVKLSCRYDTVFDEGVTQAGVYDAVKDCARHAVDGFNSTLIAYGQTSSGKTYTLFGADSEPGIFSDARAPPAGAGVIPRAVRDIFALVAARGPHAKVSVFCSFTQVRARSGKGVPGWRASDG